MMALRSKLVPLAVALACGCVGGRPDAAPSGPSPSESTGTLRPAPRDAAPADPAPGEVAAPGGAAERTLVAVSPRELSATSGEIVVLDDARFSITSPALRAELGREPRSRAEVDFVYRGPTASDAPLASGELRRQIGLKLRAQDSCNVVYVMWHIEPSPGIVVSVKSNPGQSRHTECGDKGYSFLHASSTKPVPRVEAGQPHVLGAAIVGRELRVTTDGEPSWVGELPEAAFEFDGPVGLRSDNGEFSVELRTEKLARK
jgi:hypothetical protein